MATASIDLHAILMIIGKWSFIGLITIVLVSTIIRFTGILKLSKCPKCSLKVSRSKRKFGEHFIGTVTFGILPVKRYRCYGCYWEGSGL